MSADPNRVAESTGAKAAAAKPGANGTGSGGKRDIGAEIKNMLAPFKNALSLPSNTPSDSILRALIEAYVNSQKENAELRSDLKNSNTRNDDLSKLNDSMSETLEKQRITFAEAEALKTKNNDDARKLTGDLGKTNAELLSLQEKIKALETKLRTSEESSRSLSVKNASEINDLNRKLQSKEKESAQNVLEINKLKDVIQKLKDSVSEREHRIAENERKKEEELSFLKTKQKEDNTSLIQSHNLAITELRSSLTTQHDRKLRTQTEEHTAAVTSLKAEVDAHRTDALTQTKAVTQLNTELEETRRKLKELHDKLASAESQQRGAKAEASATKLLLAKAYKLNAEHLNAATEHARAVEELRGELIRIQSEHQKQLLAMAEATKSIAASSEVTDHFLGFSKAATAATTAAATTAPVAPEGLNPLSSSVTSLASGNGDGASSSQFVDAANDPASPSSRASSSSRNRQ